MTEIGGSLVPLALLDANVKPFWNFFQIICDHEVALF